MSMFIRRKPNVSGSISIQVLTKTKERRQKVVKTIGVGRSSVEIARLEQKARDFIDESNGPFIPGLFGDSSEVVAYLQAMSNSQIQVIGPELIYGELYDHMGYGGLGNEMFRNLVICRLFNPGSKLKTIDYLYRYLHIHISPASVYRFLDRLCVRGAASACPSGCDAERRGDSAAGMGAAGIKEDVERITFDYTRQVVGGEICVCFYDMTTLYFEAAEEDELRRYGFSKDGKNACPQIFLGLLVASGGNPIGYEIYEGNTSESRTIVPLVKRLSGRFGLDKPVVVADSGLLTKKNMAELEADGYQYIIGARPKNESEAIRDRIMALGLQDGDIAEICKGGNVRLILSMSAKRGKKDAYNRQRGLSRLQRNLGSGRLTKQHINKRGYNKYLKLTGNTTVSIDMAKFNADALWDGIKGYVTNTELPKEKIIENYGNLWYIERAFRLNKCDLAARPIYHRLRNRIEGHMCICFTAYAIMLELDRRLRKSKSTMSVYRAQELTRNMYALTCELPNNSTTRIILKMTEEQQELYDAVKNYC